MASTEAIPTEFSALQSGIDPLKHRAASRIDEIFFGLLLLGIAAAPFWFGSNRPVAWGGNALYFGALLVAYEGSLIFRGMAHPVALKRLWLPALAFLAVVIWIGVQLSGFTPQSWHHPLWGMAADALGHDVEGRITVNPQHTWEAGLRLLTAAAVFWLALQLCRNPWRASKFLQAVALIGFVYAGYGLIAHFLLPDRILWYPKLYYKESVTATFINRNNAATYFGLALIACLGTIISTYRRATARVADNWRFQLGSAIETTAGWGGFLLVAFFTIGVALILTGSRAGIVSSLAGLMALSGLLLLGGRKHGRFAGLLVLAAAAVVVATVLIYGDLFFDRLSRVNAAGRTAVYAITWQSVGDAPILGMGYGTFEDIFPMYRDTSMSPWDIWDKAHDTYLELLQGLGVPMAACLIGAVVFLVFLCLRGATTRQRSGYLPAVAVAGSVLVGLHSFVDFSLQIQAVALTWIAILGAGVAQSWSSRIETGDGLVGEALGRS
ncbi:O-antigen ligase family protein [Methyloligella sp. 2.7D]|uniref:O-antigen ligase family protein n=1 Tax=Methyloligella sp. 2.7D TaxID=3085160 RepID=UPI002FD93038